MREIVAVCVTIGLGLATASSANAALNSYCQLKGQKRCEPAVGAGPGGGPHVKKGVAAPAGTQPLAGPNKTGGTNPMMSAGPATQDHVINTNGAGSGNLIAHPPSGQVANPVAPQATRGKVKSIKNDGERRAPSVKANPAPNPIAPQATRGKVKSVKSDGAGRVPS